MRRQKGVIKPIELRWPLPVWLQSDDEEATINFPYPNNTEKLFDRLDRCNDSSEPRELKLDSDCQCVSVVSDGFDVFEWTITLMTTLKPSPI